MQLSVGFRLRGLLRHYVSDPRSKNTVSLIVRDNLDYHEKS